MNSLRFSGTAARHCFTCWTARLAGSPGQAAICERHAMDGAASKRNTSLRRWLYISHFFSAWGWRKFEYGIGILLASLWPNSVLLPSIFGLFESFCAALGGGPVGQKADLSRSARLSFVRTSLVVQNIGIACAVLVLVPIFLLGHRTEDGTEEVTWIFLLTVAAAVLFGGLARLGNLGSNVAVEKDWVTVISEGNKSHLAEMNSTMRRIDLVCKILAPIVAGLLLSATDPLVVAAFIGAWNLLSMYPEYSLLSMAFNSFPALQAKPVLPHDPVVEAPLATSSASAGAPKPATDTDLTAPPTASDQPVPTMCESATASCTLLREGWAVYARQQVFPAALALAMLYVSTIAFGSIMTVFLNWVGIPIFILSAARGVGALFGVLATVTFEPLRKRFGVLKVGIASVWCQLLCVCCALAIMPYTISGATMARTPPRAGDSQDLTGWEVQSISPVPLWASCAMIAGVVLSRFGLWSFDLSVTYLLQLGVSDDVRGTVNGVQQSVSMLAGFLEFVMGILFSNAASFGFPTAISVLFVFMAACLFTWYVAVSPRNSDFEADEEPSERTGLVQHAQNQQQAQAAARDAALQEDA